MLISMVNILFLKQILYRLFQPDPSKSRYYVGLIRKEDLVLSDAERYARIRWVKSESMKDNWIADPFILSVGDGRIQILAEQLYKGVGRLVLLEVDLASMEISRLKVILQLPTHLSFPYIWQEDGEIYIMPENVESGSLRIWRYNVEKEILEDPREVINEPLVDAQICKIGEKYYIMGVKYVHNDYFMCTKYLEIYSADSLFGLYSHLQTIDNELRLERGAGMIWHDGDTIMRPAQNCENGYGTNLLFYRMKLQEVGNFSEMLEYEYHPDKNHPRSRAFHTFNEKDGYVVVDGNAYVNPRWSKFFYGMKDFIISILKH